MATRPLPPLTRTYAVANLDAMDVDPVTTNTGASGTSEEHAAVEAEISGGGDTEPDIPVEQKRGRSRNKPKPVQARTRQLPVRRTRVVDPAGPDRPRPKRTSAEVKVVAVRKAQLQETLTQLNERKIQALAEMDAEEELMDTEEHLGTHHVVNTTSMDGVDDIEDWPSAEEQERPESDPIEGSQEEVIQAPGPKKGPAKRKSRARKPAKGETRQAVEAATEIIKSKRKATAAASSVAKKQKAASSGRVCEWQSKVKSDARKDLGRSNTHKNLNDPQLPTSESPLPYEFGGLVDEDADAVAPPFDMTGKDRNPKRINEFVKPLSSSEEDSVHLGKSRGKPTRKNHKKVVTTSAMLDSKSSKTTAKHPVPVKAKREPSVVSLDDGVTITTSSHSSSDGLPTFARAGWATRFIPTLGHCLANALNPWDIGNGVDIIAIIQGVLDTAYPSSGYQVQYGDRVYSMAKDRLNDRRTLTGRQAIKIVDGHFAQPQFANNPRAIAKYAQWAIRPDGPMIWQTPTPMECTVKSSSLDYIKPQNIFESQFMIALLTPFVRSYQGSCYDYGNPKGALALGAAALHRAFSMYITGTRVKAPLFSRENIGETVAIFAVNSQRLTDRRWAQIMTSYGIEFNGKQGQDASDDDLLDEQQFRDLYVPSSP